MCYRILEILQWVRVTSFFIFRIFLLFIRSREFYYKRFIFRSLIPISVRFAVILIKIIGIVNTLSYSLYTNGKVYFPNKGYPTHMGIDPYSLRFYLPVPSRYQCKA